MCAHSNQMNDDPKGGNQQRKATPPLSNMKGGNEWERKGANAKLLEIHSIVRGLGGEGGQGAVG